MPTSAYQDLKLGILELTNLSRDAIHIYIGLAVLLAFVVLIRKGKIDLLALLPVLSVAIAMESIDLYDSYYSMGAMYWGNSLHDLINTLFWPTAIVLLVKFKRVLREPV